MQVKRIAISVVEVDPSQWIPFDNYEPTEKGEYDVVTFATNRTNSTIKARWDGKHFIGPEGRLDRVIQFIKVRTANEAQSALLQSFPYYTKFGIEK